MKTAYQRPELSPVPPSDPEPGMSRGSFLRRAGLGIGAVAVTGAGALGYRAYDQGVLATGQGAAYEPWSDWKRQKGLVSLVGAATLAPSPHNAQAWLFRVGPDRIDLFADRSRTTGATDPFQREMYIGLGAALENLALAAQARGHAVRVTLLPDGPRSAHAARIALARSKPSRSGLYDQIAKRRTNRYPYLKGKDVPRAALAAMAALGPADAANVRLFWFTSNVDRARIGGLLVAATEALIADPDQSRSDYDWFRQSWDEIQRQRDGITVDAAGISDVTAALAKLMPAQSRKATDEAWLSATRDRQTNTAAAYGIVAVRDASDNRQRLEGGRALERMHLWTAGHGLAFQHMNQLTERADREVELAITPRFGDALDRLVPSGWQALSTFRTGYPTHAPHESPRRAVEAVIVR
jgi:nitroreductase